MTPAISIASLSVSGLTLDEACDLMERLSSLVAILDGEGKILAVNRSWKAFAAAHGGDPEATGVGVDFLEVCEQGEDDVHFASDLERVLSGDLKSFENETQEQVGVDLRIWRARVTRLVDPSHVYLMVTYEQCSQRVPAA